MTIIAIIEVTYKNYTEREIVYKGQEKQVETIKKQSDFVSMEVVEGKLPLTAKEKRTVKSYWNKFNEQLKVESDINSASCGEEHISEWQWKQLRKKESKLYNYLNEKSQQFTRAMFAELERIGYAYMSQTYEEFSGNY